MPPQASAAITTSAVFSKLNAPLIAGATTPDQVRANVAAAAWELSAAERDALRNL